MVNKPKIIPGTPGGDGSLPARPSTPDLPLGTRRPINPSDTHSTRSDLPSGSSSSDVTKPTEIELPSVVVSKMPTSYIEAHQSIAWPPIRYGELKPVGENSGLFEGPELQIYAEIGTEGRFLVERNPQGTYYVPLSFAPGVPGPVLAKIDGQPRWRIERPGWQPPPKSSEAAFTQQPSTYLNPDQVALLTKAESSEDGIRFDKNKQTYVDLEEGTVRVGKNRDGLYQETSARLLSPSGAVVEPIPGTKRWRRKPLDAPAEQYPPALPGAADEPTPHSSKRQRLETLDSPHPGSEAAVPAPDQTPYFWLPWGHLTPPASAESVQLGWLHYVTVPTGTASDRLPRVYFLQHPEFAPAHFDAFEQMLQEAPHLQPVATFRIGDGGSEAHQGRRLFEKPLSQSVAETFVDFSASTSRAVARRIFELSDDSPVITTTGLINIQAALHQWKQKPFFTTPAFADPMNMLPVAPLVEVSGVKYIKLVAQTEGELQRLTFDPQRFPFEWGHYKTAPTHFNLRRLVGALLIRSGYRVFPLAHEHSRPMLVFSREGHDKVFFLKLGVLGHVDAIKQHMQPGSELTDPGLSSRIGSEAHLALTNAQAQDNVVWLIGGVLQTERGVDSVFILRER